MRRRRSFLEQLRPTADSAKPSYRRQSFRSTVTENKRSFAPALLIGGVLAWLVLKR